MSGNRAARRTKSEGSFPGRRASRVTAMLQAKIEKALREALKQLAANGRPAGLTFS